MPKLRASRFVSSIRGSDWYGPALLLLASLSIPAAIFVRVISLNQGLLLAIAFAYVSIHRNLDARTLYCLSFLTTFIFVQTPIRSIFGIDLLPLLSIFFLLTAISREKKDSNFQIGTERGGVATLYIFAGISFALVTATSSVINYRNLEFLSWALFPLASAVLVGRFRIAQSPKFSELMTYWLIGASVLALLDTFGLATGRFRATGAFNAGRFLGSLGDYELSAEVYGLSILVAVFVILSAKSQLIRVLALIEILAFTLLLVSTQTRSAFLLALIGTIGIVLSSSLNRNRKRSLGLLGLIAILTEAWLSAQGSFQDLLSRFASVEYNQDLPGVANRASVWDYFQNLKSFTDLPLLGNGFSYPYSEIQSYPHSLYLWVLWSGGFLAFLLLILAALASASILIFRWKTNRVNSSAALILLGFVLIDQAKVEVSRYSATSWVFWLVLSVAFVSMGSRDNELEAKKEEKST